MAKLVILLILCIVVLKVLDELSICLFGKDNTSDGIYGVLFIAAFFGTFLTFDPFLTNCVCVVPIGVMIYAATKFFIKLCIGLKKYISQT